MEGKPKVLMYSYQPVKSYDKRRRRKMEAVKGRRVKRKTLVCTTLIF